MQREKKTMKITIFIGGLIGGGTERVVCNLANYLSFNHEVMLLTMSETDTIIKLKKEIVRISLLNKIEMQSNFIIKNIKRYIRLRKHLKNSNSEIFLVMLPVTICLLFWFRNLIKVPIVVSERCDPNQLSTLKKKLIEKAAIRANGIVFQTEDVKKYYEKLGVKNGIIIPNAINDECLKIKRSFQPKKKIVAAGRLTKEKNFEMLIRAFAIVSKKIEDYELYIYGKGPLLGNLKSITKELSIEEKVHFPGFSNDLLNDIKDASLFVLPSNYEGMPNVLMEAMAIGLPCIATDCPVGGPRYLIENGENGILVPVGGQEILQEKILEVLEDPIKAKYYSQNAKKIIEKLNSNKIYSLWERYLIEVKENCK